MTAPFGLASKYPENWFGRFDSIETELLTINVQPSVAYRVTDWLSIGAGLDIQYADAKLTNSVFLGPGAETVADVQGDSIAFGVNIGLLLKPLPGTRVGVHYRSAISHELDGRTEFSRVVPPAGLVNSPGKADLNLPDILALGVAHELTPSLTLLGEVSWYGWSKFEEIRVRRPGPLPDLATPQNYEDTISVALGAEYEATEALTLRAGFQYDETPTRNGFRSTRTPDGDRYWLSAGISYEITPSWVVDAAYSHIFITEENIDLARGPVARVRGETSGSVDIISAAVRYRF